MKLWLNAVFAVLCAAFFAGCLAKSMPSDNVYELGTNACATKALRILSVDGASSLNTRKMLLKNGDEISEAKGGIFISYGADMLETALLKYFSCAKNTGANLGLKITLLELYATADEAVISISATSSKSSNFLMTKAKISSNEPKEIARGLNVALAELLAKLENISE